MWEVCTLRAFLFVAAMQALLLSSQKRLKTMHFWCFSERGVGGGGIKMKFIVIFLIYISPPPPPPPQSKCLPIDGVSHWKYGGQASKRMPPTLSPFLKSVSVRMFILKRIDEEPWVMWNSYSIQHLLSTLCWMWSLHARSWIIALAEEVRHACHPPRCSPSVFSSVLLAILVSCKDKVVKLTQMAGLSLPCLMTHIDL